MSKNTNGQNDFVEKQETWWSNLTTNTVAKNKFRRWIGIASIAWIFSSILLIYFQELPSFQGSPSSLEVLYQPLLLSIPAFLVFILSFFKTRVVHLLYYVMLLAFLVVIAYEFVTVINNRIEINKLPSSICIYFGWFFYYATLTIDLAIYALSFIYEIMWGRVIVGVVINLIPGW